MGSKSTNNNTSHMIHHPITDVKTLFNRMNPRLRKIICSSSSSYHLQLINSYESYIQSAFTHSSTTLPPLPSILSTILIDTPTIIQKNSNNNNNNSKIIIRFQFSNEKKKKSSTALSRLLLHAVCDFHNLHSISTTDKNKEKKVKLLTVSGTYFHYPEFHLSKTIVDECSS